jgi:DNA-binding beta-propeller fold protein YncE
MDGVKDGTESDVDCGGGCPGCATDQVCNGNNDCASMICTNNKCAAPFLGMYVSGYSDNKIHRYDANGAPIAAFSATITNPEALALGPDGLLYAASFSPGSVQRFNATTGAFVSTFVPTGSGGLGTAVGLAFGPDGNLYVSSWANNSILEFDGATGAFIKVFASGNGLTSPDWFLFTPLGLFVSSRGSNKVLLFDASTGAFVRVAAEGNNLMLPECLLLDAQDRLLVTNRGNSTIDRYDANTGAFIDHFLSGNGISTPLCVISGTDGNLYVANAGESTVRKFTSAGGFVSVWVTAGAGGLSFPTGLFQL